MNGLSNPIIWAGMLAMVMSHADYGIVAGVNLPMLIEMVSAQMADAHEDIKEVMEKAATAGKMGLQTFHSSQIANDEEDDF